MEFKPINQVDSSYNDYMINGNISYAKDRYKQNKSIYKIVFGLPNSVSDEDIQSRALKKANSIYKGKPSNSNRNCPFKFYETIPMDQMISKNIMKTLEGTMKSKSPLKSFIYQYNFEVKGKRITTLHTGSKDELYASFILVNNTLYEF